MLTKTLKFDDTILSILKNMRWENEGRLGIIETGQVARDIYVKLNKALEAMGGKWNRGLKGHVFETDPRPLVDGLLETGALTVEKDGFFETPLVIVKRMLELVPVSEFGLILEPSAGKGAIASQIPVDPGKIVCIEKNTDRANILKKLGFCVYNTDFLTFWDGEYARIYMNPPFEEGQDVTHVLHAYDLLEPGGILISVMCEGTFFRQTAQAESFRQWANKVNGVSYRLPEGSFKESGTGVNARLVVIEKD